MGKRKLPSFFLLWATYPKEEHPCKETNRKGEEAWSNQCAIRLSVCLEDAGFKLINNDKKVCKHGHLRGADSFGRYLRKQIGSPKKYKHASEAMKSLSGKRGIVLFHDIAGFRGGVGDHIDIWNGGDTKTGEYFADCKETRFWEVGLF